MAATAGVKKCQMCGEEITDPTLHYRRCKAMEDPTSQTSPGSSTDTSGMVNVETARVQFSWTSSSGYSYSSVTLLSGFQQSIELHIDHPTSKCRYLSDTVEVPVGEFDGQLVIGSSYCYPVKKFLIDHDGEVIPLELDLSKLDTDHDHDDDTHNGKYSDYMTAYTTSSRGDPDVHYNPSYNARYSGTYGYDDDRGVGTEQPNARLLMIFTPTSGSDADAMYQPVDVVYTRKTRRESPQVTSYPHNDTETSPTDPLGEEFSQQLSEEGFTPAAVKSKKSSPTTAKTTKSSKYSSSDPSTQASSTVSSRPPKSTRPPPPSPPKSPPPRPQDSSTHTTTATTRDTDKDNQPPPGDKRAGSGPGEGRAGSGPGEGRFSVSNIQSSSDHVGREEHTRVCEERDRLRRDHQRVKAQLEGQIKRLQMKVNKFEGGDLAELTGESDDRVAELEMIVAELREDLDESQRQLEAKERELAESQDRTTALEEQLQEYAGTIQDQNRVIHNYTHHGGLDRQYTKLQELNSRTTEFIKKQQIEFTEKIQDMEKKIKSINMFEFEEENRVLRESCEKMTRDIRDYRAQTKQLLKDIEARRKETLALKEELQRRGGSNPSEMEALEVEALRQKCDGWRESAERSSEEAEVLRIQVQQLEQERDSLNQELQGLAEKLQSALSDKEAGQSKTSNLQKQVKELQDTRVSLEIQLGELRSEKTELAERNAHLVEACDPNNLSKVKQELELVLEEKEILERELKSTQDNLALHQERNLELQEQLEKTSDPQKLTQIQQRMQRYKQERESAKKELEIAREEVMGKHREVEKLEQIIEELKGKKRKYREGCKSLEQVNEDLQAELKEKNELIAFLQNVHDYGNEEEEDGEGVANMEKDMGVSHPDSSYSFSPMSGQLTDNQHLFTSSTHSVPAASRTQRKTKSGVITTTTPKVDSTPRGSYTSLIDQPPRRSSKGSFSRSPNPHDTHNPSLNIDETIISVQVRTNRGLREAYVQQMDQDTLGKDIKVVVKRKGGVYEEGVVRYYGCPNPGRGELLIGIELAMQRTDSQGANNDGTYKDHKRYFKCARGHGLFTTLSNLYIEIITT